MAHDGDKVRRGIKIRSMLFTFINILSFVVTENTAKISFRGQKEHSILSYFV